MDSIDRVQKMKEKEALSPIFKKLDALKEAGHLDKEMYEDMKVMLVGYFFYRGGVEIMGARLGVREGVIGCHFPETKIGGD